MTDLPDVTARARTIAILELSEFEIGLLEQQRGAGRGAASTCDPGLDHDRRDASGCKCMGDQGAGHPGAHNRDIRFVVADKRGIPLLETRGMTKPHRATEP
jgi:hypothetical protein